MLILVRKPDERVRITHPDGDIWVRILAVEPLYQRVKLGIDAPASVHILRGELEEPK